MSVPVLKISLHLTKHPKVSDFKKKVFPEIQWRGRLSDWPRRGDSDEVRDMGFCVQELKHCFTEASFAII